jgi:hypothetical protein
VDLGDRRVIETLHLTGGDLFGNWLWKTRPTPLEKLGRAIAGQRAVTALRFPSAATRRFGREGWNVAIFRAALKSPDRIEILGNSGDPLEVLP